VAISVEFQREGQGPDRLQRQRESPKKAFNHEGHEDHEGFFCVPTSLIAINCLVAGGLGAFFMCFMRFMRFMV